MARFPELTQAPETAAEKHARIASMLDAMPGVRRIT
jgi:hypothetical protein